MIYYQGNTLYDLRKYEESIIMYDHALKINPNYINAYFNKGKKYWFIIKERH